MDNRDLETIERLIVDLELEKPKRYSPEELQTLTSDFSKKLGSGSFGTVYKGILHNGVPVAVKVLKDGVLPDTIKDQFTAEVSTLGKTHHRNLVKLYGFCFAPNVKALVYEFMENESLEKILYEKESIAWETLCDIVLGTASGLTYLHKDCEPRIIHYDIKPSNILLNSKFCPKVGDFGLAKLLTTDKSHVTMSGFRGTPYYGAPELWMRSSSATYKCDVYSYGIMLFEILGRRRFDGQKSFPEQVWEKFKQGKLDDLMQGCGIEEKNTEHAKRIFTVALWCVQYRPQDRPSMSNVVRLLEGTEEVARPHNPFWPLEFSSTMTRPIELEEKEKEQRESVTFQKKRESVILGPWGGNGGSEWDDGVFSTIKTILVSRGEREIRGIQIEYCGKNGESIVSERHGWVEADTLDKIELDYPDEYLMRITGFHAFEQYAYKHFEDQVGGLHLLRSLCFFTNKKKYGPFGNERGTYFTSGRNGKVVGFHGRGGAFLDGIGVHVEY